jgi:hypothetical protein
VADRIVSPLPWEEATDRHYQISGRHSRAYYRQADRWLRDEVAGKHAEALAAREALLALAGEVEA